jgi:tRNA(Ile)-lysidine synthase
VSFGNLQLKVVSRPAILNELSQLFLAPSPLPLHLRPRQKGDRFQPLGLGGKSKKVKDYMIDEKIPVWLRDRIYLLVNEEDEIMAIVGYCISEKFKVLPEHQEVLRVSWE